MDYPEFWSQEQVASYEELIRLRQSQGEDVGDPWWLSHPEWGEGGEAPVLVPGEKLQLYTPGYVNISTVPGVFMGRVQTQEEAASVRRQNQLDALRAAFGEIADVWTDEELIQVIVVVLTITGMMR